MNICAHTARAAAIFALMWALGTSAASYNFSYQATGEPELRPVQVFDDGSDTYFQFRSQLLQPTITADIAGRPRLLAPRRAGSYLVVPVISNSYSIHFGELEARLAYKGAPRALTSSYKTPEPLALAAPSAGTAAPAAALSSYGATRPVAGDDEAGGFVEREALVAFARGQSTLSKQAAAAILSALLGSGPIARVSITGRDDSSYVEGLARSRALAIRDRVLAAGVALDRIVVKEGIGRDGDAPTSNSDLCVAWARPPSRTRSDGRSSPEAARAANPDGAAASVTPSAQTATLTVWQVRLSDQSLEQMLRRWAAESGWKLLWQGGARIAITGDSELERPDFLQAADYVVSQARAAGYRLKATAYRNQVLVVSEEMK